MNLVNLVLLLLVINLNACAHTGGFPQFWGDRYVEDSCMRCPECCTDLIPDPDLSMCDKVKPESESNCIALMDEGESCIEENADLSDGEVREVCFREIP